MNALTGETLEGLDHLKQSIKDILMTPVGSRVMRRNYGSRLLELLDRPINASLVTDLQAAVAMALAALEPRLRLAKVSVAVGDGPVPGRRVAAGQITLTIEGYYVPENRMVRLDGIRL